MKTKFVRSSLAIAVGISWFAGCARPAAQSDQPVAVVAPVTHLPQPVIENTVAVNAATHSDIVAGGAPATNAVVAPVIEQRIPPTLETNITAGMQEVVKLAEAGVGEEVILAFIEKYPEPFDLTSDDIVYLSDLGIPNSVVTAMLKHDGMPGEVAGATAPETAAPPSSLIQTQTVSNVPLNQVYAESAPAVEQPAVAAPPPSSEVAYFYDSLSPYGSWIYVSSYGWCWQPTVAVVTPAWRPYVDRGRWYWSDSGWYWHSDYTWGWAPFHYGRWYHHPHSGWLWYPGTVWAPSWVSWRFGGGYCGWAPLPPEAYWVSGVGFSYYGRHVGFSFDFGLGFHHYAFVSAHNFCSYTVHRHVLHHDHALQAFRDGKVVNHYGGDGRKVHNRGIGRETIAQVSREQVREVSVREAPASSNPRARADRLEKQGNQLVVYRPQLSRDADKPANVARRMANDLSESRTRTAGGGTTLGRTSARVPRSVNAAPRGSTAEAGSGRLPGYAPQTPRGQAASAAPQTETARPGATVRRGVAAPDRSPSQGQAVRAPASSAGRQPVSRSVTPARPSSEQINRSGSAPAPSAPRAVAPSRNDSAPPARRDGPQPTPRSQAPAPSSSVAPSTVAPRAAYPTLPAAPGPRTYTPQTPFPRAPQVVAPRAPQVVSPRGGGSFAAPQRSAPARSVAPQAIPSPNRSAGGRVESRQAAPRVERSAPRSESRGTPRGRGRDR